MQFFSTKPRPKWLVVGLSFTMLTSLASLNACNDTRRTTSEATTDTKQTQSTGQTEGSTSMTQETSMKFTLADELKKDEQFYFYKNPSRINGIGDPFFIRDEETGVYTMIATSASIGYYGYNTDDLVNFKPKHWAYQRPDDAWSTDSYWAPEVIFRDGTYYMYYTARNKEGRLLISVATSDKAEGPYIDVSDKPVFDPGFAIIDASIFIDDDGQAYFYYSKDISENWENGKGRSETYGAKLNDDMVSLASEPVLLITPDQAWENPESTHTWNEGGIVIKNNNIYYLAYSANYFESPAYAVGYATSANPLGPFTKAEENPILASRMLKNISGSGHHAYIKSPDGSELFAVYHTHTLPQKPSGNRQMNIDRVLFTEDNKMVVNGPTISWLPLPSNDNYRVLRKSDYTEVSLSTGQSAEQLIDEFIAIHPGDKAKDLVFETEDGKVEISFELAEEKAIEALVFVAGSKHRSNIAKMTLLVDDEEIVLGSYIAEDPSTHTFAGKIEAPKTKQIRLILEVENQAQEMILSEIYFIENRGK